jgi:hypothetical protein
MNPTIRMALAGWALLAGATPPVHAAEPTGPDEGRVLLLHNERTLEGDIRYLGDRYSIRRSIGETWVPADQVLYLGQDLGDVYQFLRRRANLRDPDERLKLARWCQFRGLREEALAEAGAAVELRPGHAESERLLRSLRNSVALAAAPPPESEPDPGPPPTLEVSPEALSLFTRKVQPILMNTCARCHATGKGGDFKLAFAYEQNRRATQQNLAAVLGQLRRDQPLASPFLTMAVAVHGSSDQAPLKGRTSPPYRVLEDWVRLVAAHLPPEPRPRPAVEPAPLPPLASEPRPLSPVAAEPRPSVPPAAPEPPTVDEFDPAHFNRQMHPGR